MGRLRAMPARLGSLRGAIAYLPEGRAETERHRDRHPVRKLYKTARWRRLRADQLAREPLCRMCTAEGRVTAASVCDHVEPHRGDEALFWRGPFQSLCKPHHDRDKQRAERRVR